MLVLSSQCGAPLPVESMVRARRRLSWRWAALLAVLLTAFSVHASNINPHLYDSLQFSITSPPSHAGNITYTPAMYGGSIVNPVNASGLAMELVLAYPDPTACSDLRGSDGIARTSDGRNYTGKIMLIKRGDCTFGLKSALAEAAGAAIALVYSCSPSAPSLCTPDRTDLFSGNTNANITTLMINWYDGDRIATALSSSCPDEGASTNATCTIMTYVTGTGPIVAPDRDALTRMGHDIDFQFAVSRSAEAGSLPPFSTIQNPTWDPCINRIDGIWCESGRVVILDLEAMNLAGAMSPAIGDLDYLQQLVIGSNFFNDTSPPCSFGKLMRLRVLSLYNMGLTAFGPPGTVWCLNSLKAIHFVDASYNQITSLSPSIAFWTSLKALDVSNNVITSSLEPYTFDSFDQLQYLSLDNNKIIFNLTGHSFRFMSSLEYLWAGTNMFSGDIAHDAFDGMPQLVYVDLSANQITGRLPDFSGSTNLVHLDMSSNLLGGNCSSWTMPYLQYLSLGSNLLTESQDNFPINFPSLLYLDLSNNALTLPPTLTDVGAFLVNLMPTPLQTIHLEQNQLAGQWGNGFLETYAQLSHIFLSHNQIQNLPNDIFDVGSSSLIDLDVSYNALVGYLPNVPPPPTTTDIKFDGNPLFQSPTLQLPPWIIIDGSGSYYQPRSDSSYECPGLYGAYYHLAVTLDPSYFGYQQCMCNRGSYGLPPNCADIPASIAEEASGSGTGNFTDEIFGTRRFFQGIDTSFLIGGGANASLDALGPNGVQVVQRAGDDRHTIHMTEANPTYLFSSLDSSTVVRAIYVTFELNLTVFNGLADTIAVYSGGLDLRGERVTYWQGTDASFEANIPLGDMFPPLTVTILDTTGVVNFRSRQAAGTHFRANYTISDQCPPTYVIITDSSQPLGYCALPQDSSASSTIILLLVTSVIIGVLALCLLGQKMSTIRGLIHGPARTSRRKTSSKRQQAQELYGPVLSVEESWRRQLKRDMLTSALMLALETIGYGSNWLVVLQEIRSHHGTVYSDGFLMSYCAVVICSTVTGLLSVHTRIRVMREIYRELRVGVAVVPTIDMLLSHARDVKDAASRSRAATSRGISRHQSRRRLESDVEDGSFGSRNLSSRQSFGRPLLTDNSINISQSQSQSRPPSSSNFDRSMADSTAATDPSMSTMLSGKTCTEVRLSSKDPNVQLAWVQRQIASTKLTSFNLIFSTIPFLVLNQLKIFSQGDITSEWALQLSSLFASMLLGLKLQRILTLGELFQRRSELAFEVICAGTPQKTATRQAEVVALSPSPSINTGARPSVVDRDAMGLSPTAYQFPSSAYRPSTLQWTSSLLSLPAGLTVTDASAALYESSPPSVEESLAESLPEDSFDSASVRAPATSLVAPASFLFAPDANFNPPVSNAPHSLDESSMWARENHGSVLQLETVREEPVGPPAANRFGVGFGESIRYNNDDDRNDTRTVSDASDAGWLHTHMLAEQAEASDRDPTTTAPTAPHAHAHELDVHTDENDAH